MTMIEELQGLSFLERVAKVQSWISERASVEQKAGTAGTLDTQKTVKSYQDHILPLIHPKCKSGALTLSPEMASFINEALEGKYCVLHVPSPRKIEDERKKDPKYQPKLTVLLEDDIVEKTGLTVERLKSKLQDNAEKNQIFRTLGIPADDIIQESPRLRETWSKTTYIAVSPMLRKKRALEHIKILLKEAMPATPEDTEEFSCSGIIATETVPCIDLATGEAIPQDTATPEYILRTSTPDLRIGTRDTTKFCDRRTTVATKDGRESKATKLNFQNDCALRHYLADAGRPMQATFQYAAHLDRENTVPLWIMPHNHVSDLDPSDKRRALEGQAAIFTRLAKKFHEDYKGEAPYIAVICCHPGDVELLQSAINNTMSDYPDKQDGQKGPLVVIATSSYSSTISSALKQHAPRTSLVVTMHTHPTSLSVNSPVGTAGASCAARSMEQSNAVSLKILSKFLEKEDANNAFQSTEPIFTPEIIKELLTPKKQADSKPIEQTLPPGNPVTGTRPEVVAPEVTDKKQEPEIMSEAGAAISSEEPESQADTEEQHSEITQQDRASEQQPKQEKTREKQRPRLDYTSFITFLSGLLACLLYAATYILTCSKKPINLASDNTPEPRKQNDAAEENMQQRQSEGVLSNPEATPAQEQGAILVETL